MVSGYNFLGELGVCEMLGLMTNGTLDDSILLDLEGSQGGFLHIKEI